LAGASLTSISRYLTPSQHPAAVSALHGRYKIRCP